MSANPKIAGIDLAALKIIHYPDPRLAALSTPLQIDDIGAGMRDLTTRMFELMFEAKGVGLAAPQVGINVRLFVASPTYEENDRRVYINPEIVWSEGKQETEEGCLSVPGVNCRIKRFEKVTVSALNLDGQRFEETGEELLARIYQHEIDHLDGRLLIDRMGTVARLAARRTLEDLEEEFAETK